MADTHSIRLNGPWQVHLSRIAFCATEKPHEIVFDQATEMRIRMPVDWTSFLSEIDVEHFCFSRSFNFPAHLDGESVRLCFDQLSNDARIVLNCHDVSPESDQSRSIEITDKLQLSNRLEIYWNRAPGAGEINDSANRPFSGVRLQIEKNAPQSG